VNPVPDPLLLRKSGSAVNRTWDIWICSQELWPLDHRKNERFTDVLYSKWAQQKKICRWTSTGLQAVTFQKMSSSLRTHICTVVEQDTREASDSIRTLSTFSSPYLDQTHLHLCWTYFVLDNITETRSAAISWQFKSTICGFTTMKITPCCGGI
jgi:hypothetical protein